MSDKYTVVTSANFDEIVSSKLPVMIDFWAPWCGPCKMLGPIVEDMAGDYEGRAVIAKCNVDDNEALARQFGIMSIPAILFFKDGQLKEKVVGFRQKVQLAASLDKLL